MPPQARDAIVLGTDSSFLDFLNEGPPENHGHSKAAKMMGMGFDSSPAMTKANEARRSPGSSPYFNARAANSQATDVHVEFARPSTGDRPRQPEKHEFGLEGVKGIHLPIYRDSPSTRQRGRSPYWLTRRGKITMAAITLLLCLLVIGIVCGIVFGARASRNKSNTSSSTKAPATSTSSPTSSDSLPHTALAAR